MLKIALILAKMLTIRLSRIGKKKKPMYRLIVSEKTRDPYGRALEILGSYNPFTKELQVKKDRIEYYIGNGAGMSKTINNLLIEKDIIKGEKIRASKSGKKKNTEEEAKSSGKTAEKPAEDTKTEEAPKEEAKAE
ncbi:30S ribosomal protein S16 [Candidatus Parcubacteria bacterium]|nr:MAG: 30S ribosomal protein S16 [Candidatus Parcubacteria bacterium]